MSLNSSVRIIVDSPQGSEKALLFQNPLGEIRAERPKQVEGSLEEIENALDAGYFVAGFFSYELGYQFEQKLKKHHHQQADLPLIHCFIFNRPEEVLWADAIRTNPSAEAREISNPRPALSRHEYKEKFDRVRAYLESGDCYQINLTFPLEFEFKGDPQALFSTLKENTRARHTAFLDLPDRKILSLSPELFVEGKSHTIKTRPMKGTAPRGMTANADQQIRADLRADPKTIAENMMIVDLIRNDLGRLCKIGSINVSNTFAIETFPTLHQMTSDIRGTLEHDVKVKELLAAMFPCGSITGAPKIRAMEIIRELEESPRGVYTGSIGYFSPNRDFDLNVSIRTIEIDRAGRARMGVGSGLVYDSKCDDEYDECLIKGAFLTEKREDFGLIETFRWEPKVGYHYLAVHLARLKASAAFFDFSHDDDAILHKLNQASRAWSKTDQRVRLVLSREGKVSITATQMVAPNSKQHMLFSLSDRPVNSSNRYLYHKTTMRDFFSSELERYKHHDGCDEIVFINERGEITEGSYTNIFVQKNGTLITPPHSSGLLNGCLRQSLLTGTEHEVAEGVLFLEDLETADALFLGNSVRGLLPARFIGARAKTNRVAELAAHG